MALVWTSEQLIHLTQAVTIPKNPVPALLILIIAMYCIPDLKSVEQ